MTTDIDRLVGAYVKCRDHLKSLEKEFKEVKAKHKADMDTIAGHILKIAESQGVESFKTSHGTAFKNKKDFIKVSNWDVALDYILHNDLQHMLTKNVAKAAAKEYMAENNNTLPPGLDYGYTVEIAVRRK